MEENVKKYFMAGTDEEVLLGDVIETTLEKDFKDGRKLRREMEFKLTEETLPCAIGMGIIEVHEEKEEENLPDEKEELLDFDDDDDSCPFKEMLDGLIETQEEMEEELDCLEEQVEKLKALVESFKEDKKKTASSKKK